MYSNVDGDIVVFRGAFAAEKALYSLVLHGKTIQFDNKKDALAYIGDGKEYQLEKERVVEPLENALHNIKATMNLIAERTKDPTPTVFLSGKENFRKHVYRLYKANRNKTMRPFWEKECVQFLKDNYSTNQTDCIEADDGLGIAMDSNSICVSIDKDLDQLGGHHYNWVKDTSYFVDEFQAAYNLYFQMIKGDSTDNVPGIPGWGDKAAGQALSLATTPETLLWACQDSYKEHFGVTWEKEWDLNYKLLHILRNEEDLKWAKLLVSRQVANS